MPPVRAALVVVLVAVASSVAAGSPANAKSAHALTTARVAHWAPVLRRVAAHRRPSPTARVVGHLPAVTPEWTQNVALILRSAERAGRKWYEVRLPVLPNNSTGWVPRSALGDVYAVRTHLYVNRATFTATLKRDGRTVFRARVGIGRGATPTPAGEFYIRNVVAGFDEPFYGPVAFGTNARSPGATDWPGGGFVGVHGTNTPGIIPGKVSHGCIRMVNRDILRLSRLMPIGTPLTVT